MSSESPTTRTRLAAWGNVVVSILLLAATLAGVAYILPAVLGYQRYVLTGGSMTGTYDKGSLVFEQEVPVRDLDVGDVITYLPPADSGVTTLVTHRIHAITRAEGGGRLFVTKGDANPDVDPWKFQLTARTQPVARFGVPHVGWVLIALADRQVRMLVIGVPASLIALGSLLELVKALRGGQGLDQPRRSEGRARVA